MKKFLLSVIALLPWLNVLAEKLPVEVLSSNENSMVIKVTNPGFELQPSARDGVSKLVLKDGVSLMKKGFPDLSKLVLSVNVPQNRKIRAEIMNDIHYEIRDVKIDPSKGTLSRAIDPSLVELEYNTIYSVDSYYPSEVLSAADPYYIRTEKGQALSIVPFQYNPVTNKLRVFSELIIKIDFISDTDERSHLELSDDEEFGAIYSDHFFNYGTQDEASKTMYTPLAEDGSMLIICEDAFSPKMIPFINWKRQRGISTTMVLRSQVGGGTLSGAQVKTFIANYAASSPSLKYVLLVGDLQHIPSSSTAAGMSDNDYTYLVGNDHYPDLFVGRMSGLTATDIEVQVNKAINYERYPGLSGASFNKGITIGSDQGPGDNNEYDFQHEQIIRSKLTGFTYQNVGEFYDGTQGGADAAGNPTPLMIQNFINMYGAGIINYTGHGSGTSWGTSGFSNSSVSGLSNVNKLPVIISVACLNGDFSLSTCFAEAWLRAGTPAAPAGAVASLMSTINQYWNEPMCGQDHMNDILTESFGTPIKRSFAGIAMNGCMFMNDQYFAGCDMTDTWAVFGDPSLKVNTDQATPMVVTHPSSVSLGTTNIITNCNVNDADVCYSLAGGILCTGKVIGSSANLNFLPVAYPDTIYVTATAFNKTPYFGKIAVIGLATTGEANTASTSTTPVFNGVNLFPNPASNAINLKMGTIQENFSYEILNVIGQVVKSSGTKVKVGTVTEIIDTNGLQDGAYIIRVRIDSDIKTLRFVKTGN